MARICQRRAGRARASWTCRPSPRNGGPACAATASFPMPPPSTTAAGTSSARPSASRSIASWERYRDRVRAYASSQHLRTVEAFRGRRQTRHVRRLHGLQNPPARRRRGRARLQARHGGHQSRPQDRRRQHAPALRPGRRADARRSHEGGPPARRTALRLLRGRAAHQGHRRPGGAGRRPGRADHHGRVHAVALRLRPLHPARRARRGPLHRR